MDINSEERIKSAGISPTIDDDWRTVQVTRDKKMAFIFDKGLYADATVMVQQEKFRVVSLFLKIQSPVFEKLFFNLDIPDNKEAVCKIKDVEPTHFRLILKFMYTGQLDWNDDLVVALNLSQIAEKFQIDELIKKMDEILNKMSTDPAFINVNSACRVYEDAKWFQIKKIEKAALKCIFNNGQTIIKGPSFLNLQPQSLIDLLARDEWKIENELSMFHAVINWAKAQYAKGATDLTDPTNDQLKTILKDIIPLIRFGKISEQEIAEFVRPAEILSPGQLLALFDVVLNKHFDLGLSKCGPFFNTNPRHYTVSERMSASKNLATTKKVPGNNVETVAKPLTTPNYINPSLIFVDNEFPPLQPPPAPSKKIGSLKLADRARNKQKKLQKREIQTLMKYGHDNTLGLQDCDDIYWSPESDRFGARGYGEWDEDEW